MGRLARVLGAFEPRPRLVDWSLLAAVLGSLLTGVVSLGAGAPGNWVVFWAHAVVGVLLVFLLGFKLRRVRHRLARGRWDRATPLSVATLLVALAALGTGVFWALGGDFDLWFWTALNVHIGLGLFVVPLVLLHLLVRAKSLSRADFEGRRTALQFTGVLLAGALFVRLQTLFNEAFDTAGSTRRFTGSKPIDDFPVTSWVADDPDPVDPADWTLRVGGLVERPLTLDYDELTSETERRALLDCTSGWYTTQDWRGVRLGSLLDRAGVESGARWVTVRSVTGYRWSYPLAEARDLLLATHVADGRLSHGHGFPLRVVAPDRRGFQWVKWVESVEVGRRRDASQYLAVLVSGFD